jgi:hypothetical protein
MENGSFLVLLFKKELLFEKISKSFHQLPVDPQAPSPARAAPLHPRRSVDLIAS